MTNKQNKEFAPVPDGEGAFFHWEGGKDRVCTPEELRAIDREMDEFMVAHTARWAK